jgi:hypothetical protein
MLQVVKVGLNPVLPFLHTPHPVASTSMKPCTSIGISASDNRKFRVDFCL